MTIFTTRHSKRNLAAKAGRDQPPRGDGSLANGKRHAGDPTTQRPGKKRIEKQKMLVEEGPQIERLEIPLIRPNETVDRDRLGWSLNSGRFFLRFESRYHFEILCHVAHQTREGGSASMQDMIYFCASAQSEKNRKRLKDERAIWNFWYLIGQKYKGLYFKVIDHTGKTVSNRSTVFLRDLFPKAKTPGANPQFRIGVPPTNIVFVPTNEPEWLTSYLAWAKAQPDLRPPRCFVDPRVSRGQRLIPNAAHTSPSDEEPHGVMTTNRLPTALQVLGEMESKTVLVASAGSGRTSVLRSYFGQLLDNCRLGSATSCVPLLLNLRGTHAKPLELIRNALAVRSEECRSDDVLRLGRQRPLVVLFDDIDQIDPTQSPEEYITTCLALVDEGIIRQAVVAATPSDWLRRFCTTHRVDLRTIEPFSLGFGCEVEAYIDTRLSPVLGRRLIAATDDPAIRRLVQCPLLLSLLCATVEEQSPADSGNLPRFTCDVIADWIGRQFKTRRDLSHFATTGEPALSAIAHAMLDQHCSGTITRAALVQAGFIFTPAIEDALSESFQRGILASFPDPCANSGISFLHPVFQSYFASLWVSAWLAEHTQQRCSVLLSDTRWDEPFLMSFETESRSAVLGEMVKFMQEKDVALLARAIERRKLDRDMKVECLQSLLPLLRDGLQLPRVFAAVCALDDSECIPEIARVMETHGDKDPDLWDALHAMSRGNRSEVLRRLSLSPNRATRERAEMLLVSTFPAENVQLVLEHSHSAKKSDAQAALMGLAVLGTEEAMDRLVSMALEDGEFDAKTIHPASVLALVGPVGWCRLGKVLNDEALPIGVRRNCFAAVAATDQSLLFEVAMRQVFNRLRDVPTFDGNEEETRAVTREFVIRWRSRHRLPADLREQVMAYLVEVEQPVPRPIVPDPNRRAFDLPLPPDLWYRVQRSSLLGGEVRARDTNYLTAEFLCCEVEPVRRGEVLRTLAAIDSVCAVRAVEKCASDVGEMPLQVTGLVQHASQLPQTLTKPLIDLYRRCDWLWTSGIARCVALLPRTEELAVEIAAILDCDACAKVEELIRAGVFWRNNRLIEGLRRWTGRAENPSTRVAGVRTLATIGDLDAVHELINRLPSPFCQVKCGQVARCAVDPFFPEFVERLGWYETSQKTDWAELVTPLCGLLAFTPEAERGALVESWRPSIPPTCRWILYIVLQFLVHRRIYELIEPASGEAAKANR